MAWYGIHVYIWREGGFHVYDDGREGDVQREDEQSNAEQCIAGRQALLVEVERWRCVRCLRNIVDVLYCPARNEKEY
jgi:hypothetical protein